MRKSPGLEQVVSHHHHSCPLLRVNLLEDLLENSTSLRVEGSMTVVQNRSPPERICPCDSAR
jgi:hypothetical protein